jgi:mannose-1-phosphate guanylyltransferase
VCFAVKPLFPSTGFGYIEAGETAGEGVHVIASFKEKPDEQTAASFLAKGNFWWNSGMFAFKKSFYENGIREFVPALSASFARLADEKPRAGIYKGFRVVKKWDAVDAAYKNAPSLSIDNAIAEKTNRARCIIAEFSWDDIGSWDVFASRVPCTKKNAVSVESGNCSVYADIPVALCGVSDLIVAVKDGRVLVMQKGKSALIRDAARAAEKLSAKKRKK